MRRENIAAAAWLNRRAQNFILRIWQPTDTIPSRIKRGGALMPRLFTGLEVPLAVRSKLQALRGGLPGARWIDPENYHITLRFLGDIDNRMADEIDSQLAESRRAPLEITLTGLESFGGSKPRAIIAKAQLTPQLAETQAEQERQVRRLGLEPETRKFTPHVTLARLRGANPFDVADFLAGQARFETQRFTAQRIVMYSSRASTGGGPYVVEADYPLREAGKFAYAAK